MSIKSPTVLSIQSHVVSGHVGNRSAIFPLELLGVETLPINTVQFSSHSGKKGWKGEFFSSQHISDLVCGLENIHALATCSAVLSGYIGSAAVGEAILDAVNRVKIANTDALYCCDPVMGDSPEGFYVKPELQDFFVSRALPLADILTPNQFEAELLSGKTIRSAEDAATVTDYIHSRGPKIIVVTSCRLGNPDKLGLLLSCYSDKFLIETDLLPFASPPKGSGDLFSALFLGHYLQTHDPLAAFELSTNSIWSVLERTLASAGSDLALVQSQDAIRQPPVRFKAYRL